MPDFSKIQVGDTVYSMIHGYGEVVYIKNNYFDVQFEHKQHVYNHQGQWTEIDTKDTRPVLFWDKPQFEDPPPPKRKVKKTFWQNWYRDEAQIWAGVVLHKSYEDGKKFNDKDMIGDAYIGTFPTEIEWEE